MLLFLENLKIGWIVTRKGTCQVWQPQGDKKMSRTMPGMVPLHVTPLSGAQPASWRSFLCLLAAEIMAVGADTKVRRGNDGSENREKCRKKQREKVRGGKWEEKEKLEEAQQCQYYLKCKLSVEFQDHYDRTPTCLTPIISLTLPLDDQQTPYPPCELGVSHLQLIAQHSALPTPNSQNKFQIAYYYLFHLY